MNEKVLKLKEYIEKREFEKAAEHLKCNRGYFEEVLPKDPSILVKLASKKCNLELELETESLSLWVLESFKYDNYLQWLPEEVLKDVLHLWSFRYLFDLLVEYGANINAAYTCGKERALHVAAFYNNLFMVRLLVEKEADLNAVSFRAETPLHVAIQNWNEPIVMFLIQKGADVNAARGLDKGTPLHAAVNSYLNKFCARNACESDYFGITRLLFTLMHFAAEVYFAWFAGRNEQESEHEFEHESDDLKIIRLLLDEGADTNARDKNDFTPLHRFIKNAFLYPNMVKVKKLICFLLERGADINARNHHGNTALHEAGSEGEPLIEFLIEKGADIHARNHQGNTVLHEAANGKDSLIEFFIRKGANLNARNEQGETPLYAAIRSSRPGNAVELLIKNGADVTVINKKKESLLHVAAQSANYNKMQLLVEKGCDINAQDAQGKTPLHKIIEELLNCYDSMESEGRVGRAQIYISMIRLLLSHKANITLQDENREDPVTFLERMSGSYLRLEGPWSELELVIGSLKEAKARLASQASSANLNLGNEPLSNRQHSFFATSSTARTPPLLVVVTAWRTQTRGAGLH